MTNVLHAIILGIVQGLTELLPISSSAHLYALPELFNWEAIGDFDVALHAGTLLAIGIFFFKDWIDLIVGGYKKAIKKQKKIDKKLNFLHANFSFYVSRLNILIYLCIQKQAIKRPMRNIPVLISSH